MTEPRREHLEPELRRLIDAVPEQYRDAFQAGFDGPRVPEPEPRRAGCLSLCVALVVVLWRVGW